MGKYDQDSKELLNHIGGKENIQAVTHCITRMRFVLSDPSKADIEAIEAMKVVKGSFTQSGQFQVIIGNNVADFYQDFVKVAGVEGVSKDVVKEAAKSNQTLIQRIVSVLAEIFAPLIPAIITGGLILGFRNCIDSMYLFEHGTKTLCQISQFWAGMDSFLWLIGEAIFHMLPVGICWSVTKKMGTTQMLGIVLGLTLVSGQLLNAYSVATTAAADIPKWDFGFVKVNMIGYQAQVLPAILAAFVLVYLEKFFRKITPQVVSMIVVPFCSLVLSVMIAHFVVGPIGWKIGSAISAVVYAGITGSFKVVFGAIFGFVYAPLVITGLHHMSNAIDLQLIADYNGTMLWPMIALSNIAQGSAVVGMMILQRKNAQAQEVNIPSGISCYLGVTEPAIFGVNLKHGFPFICGISHCSDRLCCHINNSECDRCRRNSRNLIHSAKIYGKFCNLYVDRNRYPNRINTDRRKEKVIQRRKERKNDRRNRRNYRKKRGRRKRSYTPYCIFNRRCHSNQRSERWCVFRRSYGRWNCDHSRKRYVIRTSGCTSCGSYAGIKTRMWFKTFQWNGYLTSCWT